MGKPGHSLSIGTVDQFKECFKTCTVTLHVIEAWVLFSSPFIHILDSLMHYGYIQLLEKM